AAAVAATTVLATALTNAGAANAAVTPKAVPNTKPAWTAHAQHLGAASSKSAVRARVYLAPRGGLAAVEQLAAAQATPGSAQYHRFITAAQYRARFEPARSTVSSVEHYLRSSGLTVTGVGASNRYVAFKGT